MKILALIMLVTFLSSCSQKYAVLGNEQGSVPINQSEAQKYKKAVLRCHKTGGTRVVKILGNLNCY